MNKPQLIASSALFALAVIASPVWLPLFVAWVTARWALMELVTSFAIRRTKP